MGNPNKDSDGAMGTDLTSPLDVHQAAQDLSWEREARDTALAKQVAEALAREMTKAHMHYQALLNGRSAAVIPTSLEVTSKDSGYGPLSLDQGQGYLPEMANVVRKG